MTNKPPSNVPPKWPLRLLRFFLKDSYLEEIEGDMEEIYQENLANFSSKRSRLLYTLEAVKLLRPSLIKHISSPQYLINWSMFRHNFTIAFRHFRRYKNSFSINLMGLSTGLACFILIFLWVQDEWRMDKFHTNDAQLYQVMVDLGNGSSSSTNTAGPTGEGLVADMPEVLAAVTARTKSINSNTLSIEDTHLRAKGLFASEDFFRLFSYDLLEGTIDQTLTDIASIVISESLAQRFFGQSSDVVGKQLVLEQEHNLMITGVFKDPSRHSSLQFDYVLPFKAWSSENTWVNQWGNRHPQTFLLMDEQVDMEAFNTKIANYLSLKMEGGETENSLFAVKYSDNYLYGTYEGRIQSGGRIKYVWLFSLIAVFILLIACINFMNLSTARATRRQKEVGIKKSLGAHRFSLIMQYLSESTFITTLSLLLALFIVLLFLPEFNEITAKQLRLTWDLGLFKFLLGTVLLTGLLAGSYPAFFLSKLKPISIIKGKLNGVGGALWLRKGLVVLQFSLSIILIASVWVVYQQIQFTQTQNLGYKRDNIILFEKEGRMEEVENTQSFLAEMRRIPGVLATSSIDNTLTHSDWSINSVQWPGKSPDDRSAFELIQIDYGMIELLGMEMAAGRTFSEQFQTDSTGLVFNEAAIRLMGLEEPVGMQLDMWNGTFEIIGVVKDFHFESFHKQVKPLVMYLGDHGRYIMVKIDGQRTEQTLGQLHTLYQTSNPGFSLDYSFLDEDYAALYVAEQRVSMLSRYFAGLAILISCLGLFGLAMFTAAKRRKEMGIRKILGASSYHLVRLLSDDFTKMVMLSIFIALPISYFMARAWLEGFAFSINLQWWYFVGAGFLALLIAWLTVGLQMANATRLNLVECLREE